MNPENKRLNEVSCSHFQADECRTLFEIPLIIRSCENIWKITNKMTELLSIPNHEEYDLSLILMQRCVMLF